MPPASTAPAAVVVDAHDATATSASFFSEEGEDALDFVAVTLDEVTEESFTHNDLSRPWSEGTTC